MWLDAPRRELSVAQPSPIPRRPREIRIHCIYFRYGLIPRHWEQVQRRAVDPSFTAEFHRRDSPQRFTAEIHRRDSPQRFTAEIQQQRFIGAGPPSYHIFPGGYHRTTLLAAATQGEG